MNQYTKPQSKIQFNIAALFKRPKPAEPEEQPEPPLPGEYSLAIIYLEEQRQEMLKLIQGIDSAFINNDIARMREMTKLVNHYKGLSGSSLYYDDCPF